MGAPQSWKTSLHSSLIRIDLLFESSLVRLGLSRILFEGIALSSSNLVCLFTIDFFRICCLPCEFSLFMVKEVGGRDEFDREKPTELRDEV